jgi:hypothetical protein
MYHAVVNSDHKVVNIIVWDGKSMWQPPSGHYMVFCPHNEGSIGDTYDLETKTFKK